jgi:anti-sigma B factor antagonist
MCKSGIKKDRLTLPPAPPGVRRSPQTGTLPMQHDIAITGKSLTLTLKEKLIFSDTAKFAAIIQKVKDSDIDSCVVALRGLDHIDSSGLRMLLLLHDACKEKNTRLQVKGAQGQVKEMLLHCRFDTIVTLED